MNYKVECICPVGDWVGEAATWSAHENSLYWCDINRFLVHRLNINSGKLDNWFFPQAVVAISLTTDPERLLIVLDEKLILWSPKTNKQVDFGFSLPGYPQVRFNDGRSDPLGNFWVGSMRNNLSVDGELTQAGGEDGIMFCVNPQKTVSQWIKKIGIANTLCWSPDVKTFYTADSLANKVYAYQYHKQDASISSPREILKDFNRGIPDGSAIDSQGYLWNCRFGGKCIVRVAPDGSVAQIIEMPVYNVTTACFGGEDLKTLFVTTASLLRKTGERGAGSVFAIKTEVAGLPENKFTLVN